MSVEAFVKNSLGGKGSNYDAALAKAAELFSAQNAGEMIAKTGCSHDSGYIYTELSGRRFRVSITDGRVELICNEEHLPAGYNPSMVIYDLLVYSKTGARAAGEYIQLQNHSRVHNVKSYAGEGMFDKEARLFAGHCRQLEAICREMGGEPFGKGDVSLAIPYWHDLRIGLSFWDADDEFPASLNIFMDRNAEAFMHYETMWYATGDLLTEITEKFD